MASKKPFVCATEIEEIHKKTYEECISSVDKNFMSLYSQENECDSSKYLCEVKTILDNQFEYFKRLNLANKTTFISELEKNLVEEYDKNMQLVNKNFNFFVQTILKE